MFICFGMYENKIWLDGVFLFFLFGICLVFVSLYFICFILFFVSNDSKLIDIFFLFI